MVLCDFIDNTIPVDNLEDADIVVFTGGEDVPPSSYGRKILLPMVTKEGMLLKLMHTIK